MYMSVLIIKYNNWHIITEHSNVIKTIIKIVAKGLYIKSCKLNPGLEAVGILLLPGPLKPDGKVEEMKEAESESEDGSG